MIEFNDDLVEKALIAVRSALGRRLDWTKIKELIAEAAENGDPVMSKIKDLKLEAKQITMSLTNPYSECVTQSDDSQNPDMESKSDDQDKRVRFKNDICEPVLVQLDINLSSQANARKYYDKKRFE